MRIKKSIFAVLLCLVFSFGACVQKEKTEEKTTEQSEQDSKDQEEKDVQEEAEDEEADNQAKLDVITPSAYRNADGISLEKGSYISVIGKAESGAFWEEVKKGAEAAAEDINDNLGYKGKDKIKLTYNGPAEADDVDEQVNILDEELARYPVAVAISITDTQACEVQFDLATENNIPVVAFDSGNDYKGIQAMSSTDNRKAAKEAAKRMAELVGEGKVVVLAADSKSETAIVREKVFTRVIKKKYPNVSVAGVYRMDEMKTVVADEVNAGTYALDGKEPSGKELSEKDKVDAETITQDAVMDYVLTKNPDIKGVYATGGEVVNTAVKALESHAMESVSVVGYDIDDEQMEALKSGAIDALVVQNPYGMGYASVISAARAALGMGNEANINTGYVWATSENLEKQEVESMLY